MFLMTRYYDQRKNRNSLINLKKHQYEEINNQHTEETSEKCSDIIIFHTTLENHTLNSFAFSMPSFVSLITALIQPSSRQWKETFSEFPIPK